MAVYRAKPITQRDGSTLQFSNCRMAAGATGIDGHTEGKVTSTGARMRARQTDQAGGTDSGDLRQAWASYDEVLSVPAGVTWLDAVRDLAAGRMVMLDVWHASCGGPCLSGSGAYGHTMIVAPERSGTDWLVSDPWCKPPVWKWWAAAKLAAGAEEWGRRVRTATGGDEDPGVIAEVVRRLMTRWRPDNPATGDDAETGGPSGGGIFYTRTQSLVEGGHDVGIFWNPARYKAEKDIPVYLDPTWATKITTLKLGTTFTIVGYKAVIDSNGWDSSARAVRVATGGLIPGTTDKAEEAILWAKGADFPDHSISTNQAWDDSCWALLGDPEGRYPCPPPPVVPPTGEVDDTAARQAQWDKDAAAVIGPRP